MTFFEDVQGGGYIAANVIEVTFCPDMGIMRNDGSDFLIKKTSLFLKFLKEFYNLDSNQDSMVELVFCTEQVVGQLYKSQIKMYLIVRTLAKDVKYIKSKIQLLSDLIIDMLNSMNFGYSYIENEVEIKRILLPIDTSDVKYIRKESKQVISAAAQMHLFYSDFISTDPSDNFDGLFSSLSEHPDSMLSFQLIPTQITNEESFVIGDMYNTYNQIASGAHKKLNYGKDVAAKDPAVSMEYYYANATNPLFYYNIMVVGSDVATSMISSKLMSLLQAKNNKSEVSFCILQGNLLYKPKLYSEFCTYPWNSINIILNNSNKIS